MKKLIIIPTYNEKKNIVLLLKRIIKLYKSKFQILVIDGNSPDGTHNPSYVKKFLFYIQKYDLITTNRILTNLRHFIIKLFLGVSIDSSGAFRCYNLNKLKFRDILKAKDNGYSFFWESMFIIYKKNYST